MRLVDTPLDHHIPFNPLAWPNKYAYAIGQCFYLKIEARVGVSFLHFYKYE